MSTLFTISPTIQELQEGPIIGQIPSGELRALSWNQPYGSLMLHGKQETRSRNTHVRGWVLICTCQKAYTTEIIKSISGPHQMWRMNYLLQNEETLPLNGMAIAIGYLHGSRAMRPNDEDSTFCFYNSERYVWQFDKVRRIIPIPWKGKQGWATVSDKDYNNITILPCNA